MSVRLCVCARTYTYMYIRMYVYDIGDVTESSKVERITVVSKKEFFIERNEMKTPLGFLSVRSHYFRRIEIELDKS